MTPEDHRLDPAFVSAGASFLLYRLARSRHANLSGVGAAMAPGRWNLPGQEAIYTSVEKGVPLLERLAHTPKDLIPSNLAMMTIRVSGDWQLVSAGNIEHAAVASLDTAGEFAWMYLFPTLSDAKQFALTEEARRRHPLGIAVPSVIVPVWNVVLYPAGKHFWKHVSLENVEPFEFDPRLFPDDARIELQG